MKIQFQNSINKKRVESRKRDGSHGSVPATRVARTAEEERGAPRVTVAFGRADNLLLPSSTGCTSRTGDGDRWNRGQCWLARNWQQ